MIGSITIRVSAGRPNMPIGPISVIKGSACTVGVLDVPKVRLGVTVHGCAVSIENAQGEVQTVEARLVGGVWSATFPGEFFAVAGSVENGLTVTAYGLDAQGAGRSWVVGKGDVDVLDADGVPGIGEHLQNVHFREAVPDVPVAGDVCDFGGYWKIFDGVEWKTFGGSSRWLDLSDVTMDMDGSQESINNVLAKIVRKCGGSVLGSILVLMLLVFSASAEVQTARFGDLTRNSVVVTNVTDIGGGGSGVDTNAVNDLIKAAINELPHIDESAYNPGHAAIADYADDARYAESAGDAYLARVDGQYNDIIETYARKEDLAEVSATVSTWQTYWDGDDVRVTVTNYYGAMDIPSLYIEQKMQADVDHSAPWFKTVWDERTRWTGFLLGYTAITNHVWQNLADRAWGIYDSSSGAYSPDGLLQLSQEQIMIAPGMSYQKTVTAGGCAIWVLKSTNPTMLTGQTENGLFRIEDGDGNALFEIVKGDKRVVGATATGISVDGGVMTISYNSVSDEHPTLEICTDLKLADWAPETSTTAATVSWSGSSGAWVAMVTPVGARASLFAKATFEAGGNTYIRNNVATSIDKVVVGGIEYSVTVETVNGKKLMVLK